MDMYLAIVQKENCIYGIAGKEGIKFNPLIAIGELIHRTREAPVNEKYAITVAEEVKRTFGYSYESGEVFDFFEIMCLLRQRITDGTLFSLGEIEQLRPYFHLRFSLDAITVETKVDIQDAGKYTCETPLRFGFCSVEGALKNYSQKEHTWIYLCHSMADIPFSVLHYLLIHGYKIRKCEHCEKYFATKSLKTKYCMRNSPCKGHENLNCAEAVDHIMKNLKKRKKAIYDHLGRTYPVAQNLFLDEYEAFLPRGCEKRAVDLEALEFLTSKDQVRKKWYLKKYKDNKLKSQPLQ